MQKDLAKNDIKLEISQFIQAISEKNFAAANKYLKNAIEEKIKQKISEVAK